MPGLPKILVLIIIIVVIWQAFKIIGRVQKARIEEAQARAREAQAQARGQRQTARPQGAANRAAGARNTVSETLECRVCGAYVARGMGACGKPGCPFGA
ncbi:MAG TPA: hypothetical protein VHA10_16740 [Hypericibacter adhaerens]|nr:hypothetical protein [Hypericibacter adhaerens]HWA44867.1 hypothetical protein [Hypericibacter adhaerens]